MKIKVTQRDISLANIRRKTGMNPSSNCPIALAVKRTTKKRCGFGAGVGFIGSRIVLLPEIASRNINKWDSGKRMYPFTFEI